MVQRISNTAWVTVAPPVALENVGWEMVVIDPADWSTVLARVARFKKMSYGKTSNDIGSGQVTLDPDDAVLSDPLPAGKTGSILDYECLWKVYEDGVFRGEWLGQETAEDIVTDSGVPETVIAGRTTEVVLQWGKMIPASQSGGQLNAQSFKDVPAAQAVLWLLNHVHGRGVIPFVHATFDATRDSKGQPWADSSDVQVSPGDDLLSLLQRLADSLGWQFRMLEGFRLFVAQDTAGAHRENDVRIFVGGDQTKGTRSGSTKDQLTSVYATAGNGVIAQASGTSKATPHIKEGWVDAGDAGGSSGAQRVANGTLAQFQERRVGREVAIAGLPGRKPFVDFDVQDWISVEDEKYNVENVNVTAITVSVDDKNAVSYELVIQTAFDAAMVVLQRKLNQMSSGSTASGSSSPVRVQQVLAQATYLSKLADVDLTGIGTGDLFRWNGTKMVPVSKGSVLALDDLTDVDLAGATDGQVLGRQGGTWKAVSGGSGGAPSPYNPTIGAPSGLVSWHRSDLGITKDTASPPNVTAWADQSGNGKTFTTASGKTVVLQQQPIGGRQVPVLTSQNYAGRMTSAIVPAINAAASTICLVVTAIAGGSGGWEWAASYGGNGSNTVRSIGVRVSSQNRIGATFWGGDYLIGPWFGSQPLVIFHVYDGTKQYMIINGVNYGSVAYTPATASTNGLNLFTRSDGGEASSCSIAEVITWSRALSYAELVDASSKLGTYYGL